VSSSSSSGGSEYLPVLIARFNLSFIAGLNRDGISEAGILVRVSDGALPVETEGGGA